MAEPDYPVNPTYTPFVLLERAINLSGYVLNVAKLLAMPENCFEVQNDHLRERETQTDGEVTRVWYVPWSVRHEFRVWALGYSISTIAPNVIPADLFTAQQYYDSIDLAPIGAPPTQVAFLNRVIPAQDAERPWLFASSCELIAGKGAAAPDPRVIVTDALGNVVLNSLGEPLAAPCIAYVDNDQGGYTGIEALSGNIIPTAWEVSDGGSFYRVVYRPRDYTILSDVKSGSLFTYEATRWCKFWEEYNVEGIPLVRLGSGAAAPGGGAASNVLMFVGGGAGGVPSGQIPEMGVYQLQTAMINVDWHEVPDKPTAAFLYCLGKVNSAPFPAVSVRGCPIYAPGTLFCWPWRPEQTTSIIGRPNWKIRMRFGYKPWGWNNFPYPTATGISFAPATFGGAANPTAFVYQYADFNTLFQIPPPQIYVPPGAP